MPVEPVTYSDATVDLVADAVAQATLAPAIAGTLRHARLVLDALAAAGLILPDGGEERVEWGVWWLADGGGIAMAKERLSCREDAERLGPTRVGAYNIVGYEVRYRMHRVFDNGACSSGPWTNDAGKRP